MEHNSHILRHELKYLISYTDYQSAVRTIRQAMQYDPHCEEGKPYFIRSLYFDDVYSSAYAEKEAGVQRRRKHRVRIYDFKGETIKYEVKDKYDSYISKSSASITRDQAMGIIGGDFGFMSVPGQKQAVIYGLIDSRTRLLRPKVVVDYYREAFVCAAGNVRVTFDSRLRAGISSFDIFDPELPTVPAIEDDRLILEVKYDAFLPVYIRSLLRQFNAWQTSQSKYIMCVNAKNTFYRKDIPYVFV